MGSAVGMPRCRVRAKTKTREHQQPNAALPSASLPSETPRLLTAPGLQQLSGGGASDPARHERRRSDPTTWRTRASGGNADRMGASMLWVPEQANAESKGSPWYQKSTPDDEPDLTTLKWSSLEIEEVIRVLSQSKVVRAKHKPTGRLFAVKILRSCNAYRHGLLTQARIINKLAPHDNITRLHKVFESRRHVYLLRELCHGGDMYHCVTSLGHFSELQALVYMRQLVEGVKHIHDCGFLHRCLKPESILLARQAKEAEDTCVKIAGFDLACSNEDKWRIPESQYSCAYTAPEALSQQRYSKAMDVWSLGVLTYVVLGGYNPFDEFGSASEEAIRTRILKGNWSFNDAVWARVSVAAKDFVGQLMVVEPTKRMSTDQCLAHPWMQGTARVTPVLGGSRRTIQRTPQRHSKYKLELSKVSSVPFNATDKG